MRGTRVAITLFFLADGLLHRLVGGADPGGAATRRT